MPRRGGGSIMSDTFQALILRATDGGKAAIRLEQLLRDDLHAGNVLVAVEWSGLNYKDGLAVSGKGKIARVLPLIPGIDFAGRVLESQDSRYAPGDAVVLTGWGVGERHHGGYAQRARVQGDWLVPLPQGLDTRAAMALGTAGFTAMLCVMALEEGGVAPGSGPVVVTGAAGGVGSVAVALLARLGHDVHAVTGRAETHHYLRALGAAQILDRGAMAAPCRPLESQRWVGAIDTVGGNTLARVLAETREEGVVAACGLAGGTDLPTTVMPFILRGVRLQGVNSVSVPYRRRLAAWDRLVEDLPLDRLEAMTTVIPLAAVPEWAEKIVAGQVRGRVVVDVNA
jgi:acrylyl-CoA reductase (NADPH)